MFGSELNRASGSLRWNELSNEEWRYRSRSITVAVWLRISGSIPTEALEILRVPKSYAAGLEMCRPGGACVGLRPEIPSRHCVTSIVPS